jgi:hypothetical protein
MSMKPPVVLSLVKKCFSVKPLHDVKRKTIKGKNILYIDVCLTMPANVFQAGLVPPSGYLNIRMSDRNYKTLMRGITFVRC